MLSQNVLYYGKDESLPERIALRAGPLSLLYEEGDLRYVKLGDHEILRRVYVAIRDRNWGTILPAFSNIQMEIAADSFRIHYEVENKRGEIDFFWQGTITGDADGTITFTMDGAARSTFLRNRIGFCILHPAACAGTPCRVERVDGATERADLPVYIVPDQPVPPFAEMRSLAHQVMPGVWAKLRFSGDIFEMEDQRNWTDASYKTFCTPLRLPYPVEIKAGARVAQSVTLTLEDERPAPGGAEASAGGARPIAAQIGPSPLTFRLHTAEPPIPLPQIGLGVASHGRPLSEREMARLKALHLAHLRVDLLLSEPGYPGLLSRATAEAAALGAPLEVALLLSDAAEQELQQFKPALDQIKPPVDRWLIYPARELFKGDSPTAQVVALARKHLARHVPAARFAAGTNADFIFMQRTPPPLEMLDMVTLAITPQVHAFDNASIVETLEAQAAAVGSARRLAGGLPVVVSPVTLKPRFNPYATGPAPQTPPGELPPSVDVRQMSLLGAGWTAGSLKYLAESGVLSVTYYETTGWRGVMETEGGSPLPEKFRSLPGSVFPLYHVLADVGEFAGGEVIPSASSDMLRVDGLALRKESRTRFILANLTAEPQQVRVQGPGKSAWVRQLDETTVEEAARSPEDFRASKGQLQPTAATTLTLNLLPYAIARIDWEF